MCCKYDSATELRVANFVSKFMVKDIEKYIEPVVMAAWQMTELI